MPAPPPPVARTRGPRARRTHTRLPASAYQIAEPSRGRADGAHLAAEPSVLAIEVELGQHRLAAAEVGEADRLEASAAMIAWLRGRLRASTRVRALLLLWRASRVLGKPAAGSARIDGSRTRASPWPPGPTASLDPPTEAALFERYARAARELAAAQGTITLLVSHRFSTVRAADLIVVLEHGAVLESGSHDQLITGGGAYAELFALQARAYA